MGEYLISMCIDAVKLKARHPAPPESRGSLRLQPHPPVEHGVAPAFAPE
jgi:hypothetical protein